MDISAINAYIIHGQITEGTTHKSFRECLAKSEMHLAPNPSPGHPPRSSVHAEHCPMPLSTAPLEDKTAKATVGRKNCKLCTILLKKEQRTPWKCSTCKIPLCLQLDRSCFPKWHTPECDKLEIDLRDNFVF